MNNFLYIIFVLSIITHVVAGIITAAFVIPLQIKQAGVRNGLRLLRKQMLAKGFLALFIAIVSVVVLTLKYLYDGDFLPVITTGLVLLHAVGILGKSIIDYEIYHHQYSEESKRLHAKIEAIELGKAKREEETQK